MIEVYFIEQVRAAMRHGWGLNDPGELARAERGIAEDPGRPVLLAWLSHPVRTLLARTDPANATAPVEPARKRGRERAASAG